MPLFLEVVELALVLALVVPGLHYAFGAYARHRRPDWSPTIERRRLAILLLLVCAVAALSIGDDVLDGDAHPLDRSIMLLVHDATRPLVAFFEMVTLTGSSTFLLPAIAVASLALLALGRRYEALLLSTSAIAGALLVYAIKITVQRQRPALWETETYWGSSFPSGHTLVVAAVATAAVLCAIRYRPQWRLRAQWLALVWIALVGLSRLVLGVHWPTDVLVAACLGAFIPIAISVVHELRLNGSEVKAKGKG